MIYRMLLVLMLLLAVGVAIAQPPVNITYGNENLDPVTNQAGAVLAGGSLVYILNCGANQFIDPPTLTGENKGLPTADDFIVQTTFIGENLPPIPVFDGKFLSSGQVFFSPGPGQTGVGNMLYARFLNASDRMTATYFGNSTTYTTTSVNGQSMERTGQTAELLGLPAPSNVTGLSIARIGGGTITLTWNVSSNASGYNVYRTANALSWPTEPLTSSASTNWSDTGVEGGAPLYYYRVTATN